VVGVARSLDVRLVVSMGSLLADVPHSRSVPVYSAANDDELIEQLDLSHSHYEGPTGIVGVLHTAFRAAGISSASLWATVPTYVASAPSPKATLALVDRVSTLLDVRVEATDLAEQAASYEARIDELVADDAETAAYVSQLERDFDDQRREELTAGQSSQELIAESSATSGPALSRVGNDEPGATPAHPSGAWRGHGGCAPPCGRGAAPHGRRGAAP